MTWILTLLLLLVASLSEAQIVPSSLGVQGLTSPGTTASITPSATPGANKLILLCVQGEVGSGTSSQPTVAGAGLTWVAINSVAASFNRATLFRAMGSSPTTGAVTATFAESQACVSLALVQVDGTATTGTNGSGAVIQSSTAGTPSATSIVISPSLATFASVSNGTFGCVGGSANQGHTPGSGFTEVNETSGVGCRAETEYRIDNDTTVDASTTPAEIMTIVGAEIAVPSAVTPPKHAPTRYYNSIYDPLLKFVNWLMNLGIPEAHAEFRNSMNLLGNAQLGSDQAYCDYGKAWGYDGVVGDPWTAAKTVVCVNSGLKVSFNSNADRGAKYYQFRNPNANGAPGEPNGINLGKGFVTITDALYHEFESALCMQGSGVALAYNDLYNSATGNFKYRTYSVGSTIVFQPNFYSIRAVDLLIAANLRLKNNQEADAVKRLYTGLYFDENRFPTASASTCANPINSDGTPGDALTWDNGRRRFIKGLQAAFIADLGSAFEGMSGNPTSVSLYSAEQTDPNMFIDLLHAESSGGVACNTITLLRAGTAFGCGTYDTRNYGNILPANHQVQLAGSNFNCAAGPGLFEDSYEGALLIMGRAASHGEWGGWFGAICPLIARRSIHLIRAIPNWDNMANIPVGSRTWTESTDTYSSSNSFMNGTIVYARHRFYNTNHKLYVARESGSSTITLNSNEKVVNANCTDSRFNATTTCNTSAYFTQSGTTVTPGGSFVNGVNSGYILTVHRQPSLQSINIPAADQIDVCWNIDDAPTQMLPATGIPTGFTTTVNHLGGGDTARFATGAVRSANCFRFSYNPSTIVAGDVVKVTYSGGNITSGTDMINSAGKVPAANFAVTTATNNLGGGGGGTPVTTQTKYQWGLIDGGADDAPLYNTLNAQLNPNPGARARLYVKLQNITNARVPTDFPLYYVIDPVDTTDPNQGIPLTDTCTPTNVCYTAAPGVNEPTLTTERLASDQTTNVSCAVVQSAASVPLLTLTAGSDTECVHAIKFGESLTENQKIYFIPRGNGGVLLDGYTTGNLPHATISAQRANTSGGSRQ